MAKASVTVTSRVYAAGTREVELPNLTTDDNGIKIAFTRESWPAGSQILTGLVQGSNDNDQTRFDLAPFAFDGGDQVNPRTGQPVTEATNSIYWPATVDGQGNETPKRPGRVFVTVINTVSLRTAVTLTGL